MVAARAERQLGLAWRLGARWALGTSGSAPTLDLPLVSCRRGRFARCGWRLACGLTSDRAARLS
jgi:hypothetical protein